MPEARWKYGCLAAVAVVACGGIAFVAWQACSGFPFPATSPWRYAGFRRMYRDERLDDAPHPPLLALFPNDVPAGASDVRFIYMTPPGDVDLELRCVLPPADLAALTARAAPTAEVVAHGSDDLSGHRLDDDVPPTFSLGDGPSDSRLPPSFTIYVTGICHSPADRGTVWTYESGVAIDSARRVALWWMTGTASGVTPGPASRP